MNRTELDYLLERWQQTSPTMQQKIIAALVERLALSEQWIRQYALQALQEAADDDSLPCSTSAVIALTHLPEGVRLAGESLEERT